MATIARGRRGRAGTRRAAHSHSGDIIAEEFDRSRTLRIAAVVSMLALSSWLVIAIFEPVLLYKLATRPATALDSHDFLRELSALTNARVNLHSRATALFNGETFYPAELEAIRAAQRTIDLEVYIFHRGTVAKQMIAALAERARAGVRVNVTLDAVGSFTTTKWYLHDLVKAGGRVAWYHPLRWNTWYRTNNRTHRDVIVVDGRVAFVGGAGVADHWLVSKDGEPRWRDSMFRVDGDAVAALQGTFVENWLEATGEVLNGEDYFPVMDNGDGGPALVVNSAPSVGRSSRARILFQMLLAAAQTSADITSPYFLPDPGLRDELVDTVKRGVKVRILVPGKRSDHAMTRTSSRGMYGDLLQAGAEIYEYQPAMLHAKAMIIDGLWSVIGSTNIDNRSFGLNDEVNLTARDAHFAAALTRQFEQDLSESRRVSYEEWTNRPIWRRPLEWIGWLVETQQ